MTAVSFYYQLRKYPRIHWFNKAHSMVGRTGCKSWAAVTSLPRSLKCLLPWSERLSFILYWQILQCEPPLFWNRGKCLLIFLLLLFLLLSLLFKMFYKIFHYQGPVVHIVDDALQWISPDKTKYADHCMKIHVVDSIICPWNNQCQSHFFLRFLTYYTGQLVEVIQII